MRRTFDRHRTANICVCGFDVGFGEADGLQQIEAQIIKRGLFQLQHIGAERFAQRPLVEGKFDFKSFA